jgi:hypothetical protein
MNALLFDESLSLHVFSAHDTLDRAQKKCSQSLTDG